MEQCGPMAAKRRQTAQQEHAADVATYVAPAVRSRSSAVITAVFSVTKKLEQWYSRQFADLDLTQGVWAVLAGLARAGETCLTPSQLADLANVAPSSMTHRLDKMAGRGLLERRPDKSNRTRTLVSLTDDGWALFPRGPCASRTSSRATRCATSPARSGTSWVALLEIVIAGLDEIDA